MGGLTSCTSKTIRKYNGGIEKACDIKYKCTTKTSRTENLGPDTEGI